MAVRDGVVAWLGSDEVGRSQFSDAQVVDLDGAFLSPAFVDSHIHLTSTGLMITGLDLTAAASRQHCLALVAEHVAAHPGRPVWAHGWDDTGWARDTAPSTAELDAVVGPVPAYLARVDVHSAVASTALRELVPGLAAVAGYDSQRPLSADAHHLVRNEARRLLTTRQRADARLAALDSLAAAGIVAAHECAGPDIGGSDDWQELRATEHGVEVIGYWGEAVSSAPQARALIEATGARGLAGDLFVDGALGSHTAWLCEPYADAPQSTGNCYLDPAGIADHLIACTEAGVTAGFHVIGDAAVGAVVDAVSRLVERFGAPAVARCGHRLEHLEMVTAEQAAMLGQCGITASVQPNFDALWGGDSGMYARRLGSARAALLNPFSLLASAGVPMAFGSDAPVTGIDPWSTVRAASHHQTPGSAVSVRAAFAAATRGAWRAGGVADGITGTLVPGAPASYAVWETGGDLDLDVAAPADTVQRWSTDPRSRVPALPRLAPGDPLPRCRRTVHRGVVLHG
ncbi:amidohydrolase family protein [Mycobacterium sp. CVI_P3]|uniref:Amidohydrolase family protein n=1 Tax=Mycobacterium pinniadriaticum TaxID=2994102 RepID=A0ABT3SBT5_9MYCO|nr:amidohydrolase family protein [Mycobacterium pinniadriaticum]MCX2930344.1 amidohydrolase family protein [Mycobacterium pinniadriaticum]MCX2936594.1 amidohydrolase family protein [Mycobacterium pinniadriaticum]